MKEQRSSIDTRSFFGLSMPRYLAGFLAIVALSLLIYVFPQRGNPDTTEITASSSTSTDAKVTESSTPPSPEHVASDRLSALTDICSSVDSESAGKEGTQEEMQAQIDDFRQQKLRLAQNLSASSSAEHLHLAALLQDDRVRQFELLDRAISRNPSDPFLVWNAVQICSEAGESTACPLRDWERLLIAVDGQNSESWVRIAANRYAVNKHDAALGAMRYAATAAESRAYWVETIEMAERGLAAGSNLAFSERAAMAFGFAAMALPRYGDYVKMCKERSPQSVDWAYACLAYGELLENQGKTELAVSIARSIQRLALEGMGEIDKAAEVQERIEARRQERLAWTENYNPAIERLLFSNPTLFSAYLAEIRAEGEEAARRHMTLEVGRLIAQRPDLGCEQPGVR